MASRPKRRSPFQQTQSEKEYQAWKELYEDYQNNPGKYTPTEITIDDIRSGNVDYQKLLANFGNSRVDVNRMTNWTHTGVPTKNIENLLGDTFKAGRREATPYSHSQNLLIGTTNGSLTGRPSINYYVSPEHQDLLAGLKTIQQNTQPFLTVEDGVPNDLKAWNTDRFGFRNNEEYVVSTNPSDDINTAFMEWLTDKGYVTAVENMPVKDHEGVAGRSFHDTGNVRRGIRLNKDGSVADVPVNTTDYRTGLQKAADRLYGSTPEVPAGATLIASGSTRRPSSNNIVNQENSLGYNPNDTRFVSLEPENNMRVPMFMGRPAMQMEEVGPGDLVAMRDAAVAQRGSQVVPEFSFNNAAGRAYLK